MTAVSPQIVYEDPHLFVVNKPSGMIVNRAASVKEATLMDWIQNKFQIQTVKFNIEEKDFYERVGVVHRLDKETSGLLIVAKDIASFKHLQAQFKERVVQKKYFTLVHGKVEPPEGTIEAPVGRLPWNRERFGVLAAGRPAITHYKIYNYYNHYTLLEVTPHTGRTHQIRIHLKYIGHPVVGDLFYAGRKTGRDDRMWCPRLFLHAFYLQFRHPVTDKIIELTIDLPQELRDILDKCLIPI